MRVQHPRGSEDVPRAGQAGSREPARARAAIDARARGNLLNGLDRAGAANRVFEHPPQLTGERGERRGQLFDEPVRRGVHRLFLDQGAQPVRVIVDAAEHNLPDAAGTQGAEHGRELGGHQGIEDQA